MPTAGTTLARGMWDICNRRMAGTDPIGFHPIIQGHFFVHCPRPL